MGGCAYGQSTQAWQEIPFLFKNGIFAMIKWTDHKHNLPASFRPLMKPEKILEAFLSPIKGIFRA